MIKLLKKIPSEKNWDYFILVCRFLIGSIFIRYGYSKLVDGQFGLTVSELATPLRDLSLLEISWYIFDQQPFKYFIGISQLICGILLLINRTAILGAFIFLPIAINILIIDLTVMPQNLAAGFAWRLSFYILFDLLILWNYKKRMKIIWKNVWQNVGTKFKYSFLGYLFLPIMAIFLEILVFLPSVFIRFLNKPNESWKKMSELIETIINHIQ